MDDILNRLRADLSGRYEVEHELGRGGMAVVFLARDLRHDRRVALKVMRQDIGISGAGDRFLREIRTAAQLHHPHILPLYDSGAAGDLLFYVMPYVQGESVRQRLQRTGPFAVDEAVRITREVADALDYAHANGIVHRDIKPENILLSAGHASVADFGIARAADAAGFKTETGVAVGTPVYMSPEQALADPQMDGRADQYALGCVLYEMLAGHPPFSGSTMQAVMARHASDAVPPLTSVRSVPAALEAAIVKALAKVPADRWPSARAFADSLELAAPGRAVAPPDEMRSRTRLMRIGIRGAAVALVLAVAWLGVKKLRAGPTADANSLRLVAVLPFTSSGDTAQAALAGGLNEGVSAGLVRAKVANLGILSGPRVHAYANRTSDIQQVGRDLGVSAVVTANVRTLGQRIRVTPLLTDVATGRTLWTRSFDGEQVVNGKVQDIWTIIDTITAHIVFALQPELASAGSAVGARGPRTLDPEAYRLYLDAQHFSHDLSGARLDSTIRLLERSLARDSMYADAWVALADALSWRPAFGAAPPAEVSIAWRHAVERAIALDSTNANAFSIRGVLRSSYEWDMAGALQDFRRAVQLAPGRSGIATNYSAFLASVGENDSALAYARRGVALDPRDPFVWAQLGNRFAFAGMSDSALYAGQRAVGLDSAFVYSYWLLMNGYFNAGRRGAADSAAARMAQLSWENPGGLALVAAYYGRSKNAAGARAMLDRMTTLARKQYVPASTIGGARLAVGDRAGAIEALEASVRLHDLSVQDDLSLLYGPMKGDARYEAVRRAIYRGGRGPGQPFP